MRILMITNLFPPDVVGGYEILCGQVAEALRALGHDVRVLTTDGRTAGVAEPHISRALRLEQPFGEAFRPSRWRRRRLGLRNERVTAETIADLDPDVIFLWSQRRLTLGPARAAEASGVPVAWTLNDEYLAGFRAAARDGSWRRRIAAHVDESWFRRDTTEVLRLTHVTAISRCLRDRLVGQGVDVGGAEVIYQGPPLELFPRRRSPIDRVRRLLYVGQLHPDKGVHVAIEAVHRLAERLGSIDDAPSLTVVGAGGEAYTRRLRELADAGRARVELVGAVPHREVPAFYRGHDALIFPSIWAEPFGLTHLEAMASGLPVISTGHGGQGEVLEEGRTALLVEANDVPGLAFAICRLVESPALAAGLARRGHQLVRARLNLGTYVHRLERWLAQAAGLDCPAWRGAA
ncbi:MAG: glycosyltransferase family 4 protein [Acidobacteriota bacterium]